MKQREFNAAVVDVLRDIVIEMRQGIPSHAWGQDMMGLHDQLDELERSLANVSADKTK